MKYSFTSSAMLELDETVDFYENCRPGLGHEFAIEVQAAIGRILEYPNLSRRLTGKIRRQNLHRFQYGLVYRIEEDNIQIGAVMHLHRRPGYWKKRF